MQPPLKDIPDLINCVQERLQALADPVVGRAMAAYMRTDQPFYGVKTPQRRPIFKMARRRFEVPSRREYERLVRAVWELPHREEQYGAIELARGYPEHIVPACLPLYEQLIVEGAWWDLVDGIAPYLVGPLLVSHPDEVRPVVTRWAQAEDVWLRRSALICQIRLKRDTDAQLLFELCDQRAGDGEFWVRKALGWALREYGKVDPVAVGDYLLANQKRLSSLSFKEAARHLV